MDKTVAHAFCVLEEQAATLSPQGIPPLHYILHIKPGPPPHSRPAIAPLSRSNKQPFIPLFKSKELHWHNKGRVQCYQIVHK